MARRELRPPAVATTIGSAVLLGLFRSDTLAQWGGVIQRVIATVPLGMMAADRARTRGLKPTSNSTVVVPAWIR